MVTAYDFPSSVHVTRAGMDIILVGDSVGMVELGYDTTQQMTMEAMVHHCGAVRRGVDFADKNATDGAGRIPLLVGDMPLGSYEYRDTDVALKNAYRFIKEAGMDAVKIEGGSARRAHTAHQIVESGVAVMGHIGLLPQAISVTGGFRAVGRTATRARQLVDEALRLQDAGIFALVLECMPPNVAKEITDCLEIPTIGIGAGNQTSGQVLVFHDMLGMLSHPHHEAFMPKFCKKYASVGHSIQDGLQNFRKDVENGVFPGEEYAPYVMKEEEKKQFEELLEKDTADRMRRHDEAADKYVQTDEYEKLNLYGPK
eukprot:CAMPEP_0172444978 /NCGR_PEP_ID=MMETSP1065-20121228/4976_1 /TAXON_ID=265537 /ORGANISM="Amphiprora paludosa, Strain CCMP125" /LENGTH=312 /DNA_ID=CAMNT_0013195755 /DNA_START=21 /DNA_END=959 /DNA_ORIENTATION=-